MASSELPPVPQEQLEILEPLTPEQLLSCYRLANRDLHDHIREHHPDQDAEPNVDRFLKRTLETLADPAKRAEMRRTAQQMGYDLPEPDATQKALLWAVSSEASKYCAHVSGHKALDESPDAYLCRLVERIRP